MGVARSTNCGEEERLYVIGWKARKKDQDMSGWIILRWILEICMGKC
jgi:hypothetical protein